MATKILYLHTTSAVSYTHLDVYKRQAEDSEDEIEVIDLSGDLENSKDCEIVELDDNTYKLNLRFPSLVKDELKIDFLKNENELIITGKFNFTDVDDSDIEEIEIENEKEEEDEDDDEEGPVEVEVHLEEVNDDEEAKENEEAENEEESEAEEDEEEEEEADEKDDDSDEEDVEEVDEEEDDDDYELQETSAINDSFEWSGFEGEDDEDLDLESDHEEDEEVQEDTQSLIKDFKNHEIRFEKHFQFDKIVHFDQIQARFINDDELELIIPNEGAPISKSDNLVSIAIEPFKNDDDSTTEEYDESPAKEADEEFQDASMEQ